MSTVRSRAQRTYLQRSPKVSVVTSEPICTRLLSSAFGSAFLYMASALACLFQLDACFLNDRPPLC